jgi:hypothetical protein
MMHLRDHCGEFIVQGDISGLDEVRGCGVLA